MCVMAAFPRKSARKRSSRLRLNGASNITVQLRPKLARRKALGGMTFQPDLALAEV